MTTGILASRVVEAAQSFKGVQFRHHFKPFDLCDHGANTQPSCLEQGLNVDGMDCSGLVIASVCLAIGKRPEEWDPNYRHLVQLRAHETGLPTHLGDAVVLNDYEHVGIVSGDNQIVHASGISNVVEEAVLDSLLRPVARIPLHQLLRISTW